MGLYYARIFGRCTHVQGEGVPWIPLCGEIEMLDLGECQSDVESDARVAVCATQASFAIFH